MLCLTTTDPVEITNKTALQSQKAVTAYFTSNLLPPFVFAGQNSNENARKLFYAERS